MLPKEQHLVDICKRHIPQGHRVWVYVQNTQKHSVMPRLQTGHNLFDMRQASRRAWRLGQMWDCFVYYQYYVDTMQHRAMELTSRKLEAALQLGGSFSENGLAALSSDSSAQMALCKSLSDRIDSEDIQRKWPKINAKAKQRPASET